MIPVLITISAVMAVVLLSLITKDHAMLALHVIMTGILTVILMLWVEINYGGLTASDVPSCAMWASTVSTAIVLVRILKGSDQPDV
jgi:hypothetical protein